MNVASADTLKYVARSVFSFTTVLYASILDSDLKIHLEMAYFFSPSIDCGSLRKFSSLVEYIYEAHLNLGQKTAYTVHILHVRHDLKKIIMMS